MLADLDETAAHPIREASVSEGLGIELCKGVGVECAFEMLEGKRELQDVDV